MSGFRHGPGVYESTHIPGEEAPSPESIRTQLIQAGYAEKDAGRIPEPMVRYMHVGDSQALIDYVTNLVRADVGMTHQEFERAKKRSKCLAHQCRHLAKAAGEVVSMYHGRVAVGNLFAQGDGLLFGYTQLSDMFFVMRPELREAVLHIAKMGQCDAVAA